MLKLEPPPQVTDFNFIWKKWLNGLYDTISFDSSFETVISSPHTADSSKFILVDDDTIGSTVTVNLPAAASEGRTYHIKKLGSTANVIIDASGSETIDDSSTATLTVQYESIKLVSDGSNWWII